jgi:hypothetical protein
MILEVALIADLPAHGMKGNSAMCLTKDEIIIEKPKYPWAVEWLHSVHLAISKYT